MSKEERHLCAQLRVFEDMLLSAKNDIYQVEKISIELSKMRMQLQKMRFKRLELES